MRLIVQLLSLLVRGTALMLGLVGASLAITCLGGAWSDRLDAFTHAAPLWLMMGVGALVLGGAVARGGERWVIVGLGVATLLSCSVLMLPELWASWRFKPATVAQSDLKIVQFNIWHDNRTPEKSLAWILAQDADIVIVEEGAGDAWPAITALRAAYPFSSCDKVSGCEVWIFSRKKMIARDSMPAEKPYLAGAWATLADAKGPFTVVGVHYTWPVPPGLQQAQSGKLIKFVSGLDRKSTIVTGDFNSTPWSFTLKRQDKGMGLRRWTRALPSWPAGKFSRVMVAPAPFLPIDHVYAGSEWHAINVERGPALGSDHRPILITLRRTSK
jgi:endonuclease/exonuclease/phosphatase (EEP) superfamily protein YafD